MQKKYLSIFALALFGLTARAQDNVYPAASQKGITVITNTTVHIGNGTTLTDASVAFENGKIIGVGQITVPAGAKVIDGTSKHVYPGLILPTSDLGLKEISAGVRGIQYGFKNHWRIAGEWYFISGGCAGRGVNRRSIECGTIRRLELRRCCL